VKREVPDAVLKLVGMHPSGKVQSLATKGSIEVTGAVPDVRPYVWQASVAAAPLWLSRGTQNKVLEAIAGGLPCVVTPAVLEGLPDAARTACAVADGAPAFARALISSLQTPPSAEERVSIRKRLAPLQWEAQLQPLLRLVADAAEGDQRRS
jgi:glycosyltransferase involved in cell wall biosynthesis